MPCHEKIPTHDKVALVTAALLYNLALAYQLQPSPNAWRHRESQTMAYTLYQRALQLMQGQAHSTSDGAALMLAVSNNLATLALDHYLDLQAFAFYRQQMASYLAVTNTVTGAFHSSFFAGNLAAT